MCPARPGSCPAVSLSAACTETEDLMKVTASVKPRCDKCRVIKRKGVVRIICVNARHAQRQG